MDNPKIKEFMNNKQLDFFFNCTVPAAIQNNRTIGHTLLISPFELINRTFFVQLKNAIDCRQLNKIEIHTNSSLGEVVSALSSTQDLSVVDLHLPRKTKPDIIKLLTDAMSFFHAEVTIGKGPYAKSVKLFLPQFTILICVENIADISQDLLPCFDHIINISSDKDALAAEISSYALHMGIQLTPDALEFVFNITNGNVRQIKNHLKRIRDYYQVFDLKPINIDKSAVSRILEHIM